MRFLLDTMVWLWSVADPKRLNEGTLETLSNTEHELYLSAASVWEIAIKASIGRLPLPDAPRLLVPRETMRQGIRPLPVSYVHALGVYELPLHHGDPFDRLLVAQARIEDLVLVTADATVRQYPVEILWAGRSER